MNLSLIIILAYLVILCFWLFFIIVSLRVAFRSRLMSGVIVPTTIIFVLLSFGIILLSVFYLSEVVRLSSSAPIGLGGPAF